MTKNIGGDVSLISWDDPVLPAREVYSAVLTADGKHALVKTPSGEEGQAAILATVQVRPADSQPEVTSSRDPCRGSAATPDQWA